MTLALSWDPHVAPQGGVVIWFEGRLDNRAELVERLAPRPEERDDTRALLLAAYRELGERFVDDLEGDFALVLVDGPRRRLLCARDPLGVVPLYHCWHGPGRRAFACATRIDRLLALPGADRAPDEVGLAELLLGLHDDPRRTCYRAIRRLPAGSLLRVDADGRLAERRYWRPRPAALGRQSDDQWAAAFGATLERAVRRRLPGPGAAVGVLLSGGLDSSAVTCLARAARAGATPAALHGYTATFGAAPTAHRRWLDERRFVDDVVAGGALIAHRVAADQTSPLGALERLLEALGQPVELPNLYVVRLALDRAAADGVSVLLDGNGGDEVVSHGHHRLRTLLARWRLRRLWAEVAALAARHGVRPHRVLWQLVLAPTLAPPPSLARCRRALVSDALARRIDLPERLAARRGARPPRDPRRARAEGLGSGLIAYGLEALYGLGTAAGVSLRHPFFDRRLVELCLAMPASQQLSRGYDRAVMRRALEGRLPPSVQWRVSKGRLAPAFRRQLLRYDRTRLEATARDAAGVLAPYVDRAALRRCYEAYHAAPLHTPHESQALYAATMLAAWLAR